MEEIWLLASWIVDKWRRYNYIIQWYPKCVQVKMSFLLTNQRISSRNHTALDPGQFACWTHCRRIWWEEGWTGRLWKPRLVSLFDFFFIKKPSQLEEQVYSIPLGGARVRVPWACDGSGSGYIKGFIDANFRPGNWAASQSCQVLLQVNSSFVW